MTLRALCLGWVAGIAIEPRFVSPLWVWLAAGAALTAAGLFAVRGRARWALLTAAAVAFSAARTRATAPLPGPSFIGYYVDSQREVTLSGTVAGDPLLRPDRIEFPGVVERLLAPAGEVAAPRGLVIVRRPRPGSISTQDEMEYEYGDTLILRGALTHPRMARISTMRSTSLTTGSTRCLSDRACCTTARRQLLPRARASIAFATARTPPWSG
ncbi:MAG: DUF4131 domain-containing protein [Chloroflexi bacterium]|nr:DUF4131 domain-containing protein [Chloroflexota bacterium]